MYVLICFSQILYFLNFFQILYFSGNPPVEVAAVDQQGDERRRLSELRTFTNLQLHQIIKFFLVFLLTKYYQNKYKEYLAAKDKEGDTKQECSLLNCPLGKCPKVFHIIQISRGVQSQLTLPLKRHKGGGIGNLNGAQFPER